MTLAVANCFLFRTVILVGLVMKIINCGVAPMGASILFVLDFSTKDTADSGREADE
jgi:hypothetical protein